VNFKHLKKGLTPVLLKLFTKIEEEGTLLNSFCKASITLISSQMRTLQEKKTGQYTF